MVNRRVLVTGGSGFVGRALCEKLRSQGWVVVAPSHGELDVSNLDACVQFFSRAPKFFAIYHLAALSSRECEERLLLTINAFGPANLYQAARESGFQGLYIFTSSSEVYGYSDVAGAVFTESSSINPRSYYGEAKAMAEEHLISSHDTPIIIFRPFNHFGPGQKPQFLIPKILEYFKSLRFGLKTEKLSLGGANCCRDFTLIDDVVTAYQIPLEFEQDSCSTFNICSGYSYSVAQIVEICRECINVESDQHLRIEFNSPANYRPTYVAGSADKFKKSFSWTPNFSITEGIISCFAEMRKNN